MDVLRIALLIFVCSSCAKLGYIYEQGVGQISLLTRAKDNKEVIKNVRLPKEEREKIQKIEELKKYFYRYWDRKPGQIYTSTTILKSKAVTYLVIASPYNDVKADESCFPLMGCFPYLGFFNLDSAKEFAKEKEASDLVTWIRPVYAYSTLGYFNDTILSSFFHYNDIELTELIFHELFHTIFFVKNEVELNENLANYFSVKMMEEYFKVMGQDENLKIQQKDEKKDRELKKVVMKLASELKELYKSLVPKNKKEAEGILAEFLDQKFNPDVKLKCAELAISQNDCFPLHREWNNARFAAFLTYENRSEELSKLQSKLGYSIKDFYKYIVNKYEEYDNLNDKPESFSNYLFKNLY
jgi:predicted aminopeptidase